MLAAPDVVVPTRHLPHRARRRSGNRSAGVELSDALFSTRSVGETDTGLADITALDCVTVGNR